MVALFVIGGLLLAFVGVIATFGICVGILGSCRMVRFDRCDRCGHLGLASMREPLQSCTYCRHELLMHPLDTLHHLPEHLPHGHRVSA